MKAPDELCNEIREGFAFFGFHEVSSMSDDELLEASEKLPDIAEGLGVSADALAEFARLADEVKA